MAKKVTKYKMKNPVPVKYRNIQEKHRSSKLNVVILIALAIIALLVAANIQITQNISTKASNVLGEQEQKDEEKQDENDVKEAEQQTKEIQKEIKKQETEIETADGQKIKTKVEDDGTTKIEIDNGTLKLKYRIVNGQVVFEAENDEGEEVEIEDDELERLENEIEDELEDDEIKLVPTNDNQLAVTQNKTAALTDFPLSINVETKELVVTTPIGEQIVTVLPDEAVQNLLTTGIISSIGSPSLDITSQNQLDSITGVVEIETRGDEVVYKIKGKKTHRLLGIIPVSTSVTAFVSTQTGQAVAKQQSILANFIDFLSL